MLLFYIRHGDPTYDPDCLTPLGRRQAEAIGRRLAMFGVNKIFSSTSTRAVQTAQPACEIMKKELTQLDFCHEHHAWEDLGATGSDGKYRWAFDIPEYIRLFNSNEVRQLGKKWYEHPEFANTRFKAGMERISRESDALIASLGYEHDQEENCYRVVRPNDDRIALFAHAGFGGAFLSNLLDIPYPQFMTRTDMCHTGMTVIEFSNKNDICLPKMMTYSNDAHLLHDGMPTNYNNRIRF